MSKPSYWPFTDDRIRPSVAQLTSVDDIRRLGTILCVWAHPDDESYLAAGIMAAAVENDQTVICITATRGEAGSQDEVKWPTATLGQTRSKELKTALNELGVTRHHWLDYADGGCCKIPDATACNCLQEFIDEHQPNTILTFGPEGLTGHDDHAAVSRWVSLAAKNRPEITVYHAVHTQQQYDDYLKAADEKINIFFNIDKPPLVLQTDCDIYFELPSEIVERKHRSIAAMPSQTEVLLKNFDDDFFHKAFGIETFVLKRPDDA